MCTYTLTDSDVLDLCIRKSSAVGFLSTFLKKPVIIMSLHGSVKLGGWATCPKAIQVDQGIKGICLSLNNIYFVQGQLLCI